MTARVETCTKCRRLIIVNDRLPCPWCELAMRTAQWASAEQEVGRRTRENQRLQDRVLELEVGLEIARSGETHSHVGRSYPRPGLHPRYRLIRQEGANRVYESVDPVEGRMTATEYNLRYDPLGRGV